MRINIERKEATLLDRLRVKPEKIICASQGKDKLKEILSYPVRIHLRIHSRGIAPNDLLAACVFTTAVGYFAGLTRGWRVMGLAVLPTFLVSNFPSIVCTSPTKRPLASSIWRARTNDKLEPYARRGMKPYKRIAVQWAGLYF